MPFKLSSCRKRVKNCVWRRNFTYAFEFLESRRVLSDLPYFLYSWKISGSETEGIEKRELWGKLNTGLGTTLDVGTGVHNFSASFTSHPSGGSIGSATGNMQMSARAVETGTKTVLTFESHYQKEFATDDKWPFVITTDDTFIEVFVYARTTGRAQATRTSTSSIDANYQLNASLSALSPFALPLIDINFPKGENSSSAIGIASMASNQLDYQGASYSVAQHLSWKLRSIVGSTAPNQQTFQLMAMQMHEQKW